MGSRRNHGEVRGKGRNVPVYLSSSKGHREDSIDLLRTLRTIDRESDLYLSASVWEKRPKGSSIRCLRYHGEVKLSVSLSKKKK